MPVAPVGMDGAENTQPLSGTCNLPNMVTDDMMVSNHQPIVPQLVDCKAKAPSWEKTNCQDWWKTTTAVTSHADYVQRKELQENVKLPVNGVTRPPPQFKDTSQNVVQLFVCFFCEKDFQNKEGLQSHQKICSMRPAHLLQDLCTPNKQMRPRINIQNPRKNMYVSALGLLPVEKAKHMELAHRIRRDSQIECDLIEVDNTPLITPRTPTTPRTPKSLISFNTPSVNKQPEVYTVSSDDDSDAGSSDGSLLGSQDYICHAPMMSIDFSSPLGQRIKGHIKQVTKTNGKEYEKFCRTPVKNRFKERLRERDSFAMVTFKHKRHFRKYYHTYRFTKDDSRDFMAHLRTGLNKSSRDLLKKMKRCRVVLSRLSKDQCEVYKQSRLLNICIRPLTPVEIDKWTRRSSTSDSELPDLSCTFPSTPVVKCYDLKSLLGATPSRLAVLDKDSEEVDEHTRNRVIVYKAILADAMQDTGSEAGPSKPNGQYVAMRSLLRRGNPNPLPMMQQTRMALDMEGTGSGDGCVFSHSPSMESQQKEKLPEKKAEYVPQMLTSLNQENNVVRNSAYQVSQQNVQRGHPVLPNKSAPNYRTNPIQHQSQSRQAGVSHFNNIRKPESNIGAVNSVQSVGNNRSVRRSGRTRLVEDKIDDEISILVSVTDDTSPPTNSPPLNSGTKRPLVTNEMSGPSSKMPRLDMGRQTATVQPRQVVKRLMFDTAGNQSKPSLSVQPTRAPLVSPINNNSLNPRIDLGSRQAHNINLASPKGNHYGTRQGTNAGVNQAGFNTANLPKLGVHESGKTEDNNFLFKCHLCGLEEQYSVNATNKIYNHLHTVHKEEVIHIVDYNTQGEVHLVEAMGQPPNMIRTSNFSKPTSHLESSGSSNTNPPAYYGISSEPTHTQEGQTNNNCVSSVPSVEGAWYNNMKSKPYSTNVSRQMPQTRGKPSPQYSLRPKTPPKSYGQPTPPTTPQRHVSAVSRQAALRMKYSGTKTNNSRSIIIDDDDVVCLDDEDVICMS